MNEREPELGWTRLRIIKLIAFYVGFISCLGVFFSILLVIFLETLDYYVPTYQEANSKIGDNPGLGFRPMPRDEVYSSLIWFRHGQDGTWMKYVDDLQNFLQPYYANDKPGEYVQNCNWQTHLPEKRVCSFPMERIDNNCSKAREFGYDLGQPCILIKLNRIYGWQPFPYSRFDFPHDIPNEVKNDYDPRNVYISCDGETDADKEHIGPISYYPSNYIPNYYFPFTNLEGYLSPFIFVHFLKPMAGVVVSVECKAWAANIKHNRMERMGMAHFELMVD